MRFVVVLIVGAVGLTWVWNELTGKNAERREAARVERELRNVAEQAYEAALRKIELKNFRWEAGGFGSVMLVSGTLRNTNNRSVKDVELSCVLSTQSNTPIGSVAGKIYEIIPAGGRKRFSDVNFGFINSNARKAACHVTGMTSM